MKVGALAVTASMVNAMGGTTPVGRYDDSISMNSYASSPRAVSESNSADTAPSRSSHDANQLMLLRYLPIPRHRAIPSWNQDNSFRNWLDSREGPCCADVSTFPECRFSEGFYRATL